MLTFCCEGFEGGLPVLAVDGISESGRVHHDGNTNTSKSWQADTNGQLYRTDYLVTDHLAVAHSDSV
ncbi:hypothetical protein MATL_G00031990 [Megalops atlanticus]|uniref:Uncharacterized protein n=1 Tax=Megalops atlanticus TaxID=7932 RepID=A0A9D3TGE5_MEGAT|nr:hypothetical protein MATL_G00031990 [Megalops atlanticus]